MWGLLFSEYERYEIFDLIEEDGFKSKKVEYTFQSKNQLVNQSKGYELEMGVNGTKEMQLEIAETSVGAGYMFPK